jgi:hypothetical protein
MKGSDTDEKGFESHSIPRVADMLSSYISEGLLNVTFWTDMSSRHTTLMPGPISQFWEAAGSNPLQILVMRADSITVRGMRRYEKKDEKVLI